MIEDGRGDSSATNTSHEPGQPVVIGWKETVYPHPWRHDAQLPASANFGLVDGTRPATPAPCCCAGLPRAGPVINVHRLATTNWLLTGGASDSQQAASDMPQAGAFPSTVIVAARLPQESFVAAGAPL